MPTSYDAHLRHARHYLAVLLEANALYLGGSGAASDGLDRYDREELNIRRGHHWTVDHADESVQVASIAIQYPVAGADILLIRQHSHERIVWLIASLHAAHRHQIVEAELYALTSIGFTHFQLGQLEQALIYYRRGLALSRRIPDHAAEGDLQVRIGTIYTRLNHPEALGYLNNGLDIVRQHGDTRQVASAYGDIGSHFYSRRDFRRALRYYTLNLELAQQSGDVRGEELCLGNIAAAYGELRRRKKAAECVARQLTLARRLGDLEGEGHALHNLGRLHATGGRLTDAVKLYSQCVELAARTGDSDIEASALGNWALAADRLGNRDEAITLLRRAMSIYQLAGSPVAEKMQHRLDWWYWQMEQGWWRAWRRWRTRAQRVMNGVSWSS